MLTAAEDWKAELFIILRPLASKERRRKKKVSLNKKTIRGTACGTFLLPALTRMLQNEGVNELGRV